MKRVFLLSPANSGGRRAQMLVRPEADFEFAWKVRAGNASIGEIFSFLSGLYFRGKMAYANAYANPPGRLCGAYVITPTRGLIPSDEVLSINDLAEFSGVPISADECRYTKPLGRSLTALDEACGGTCEFVLLGSIATGKYVDVLLPILGERLVFPALFVGRGDMSRGGLMLRAAREGKEMDYIPVFTAVRHGKRPPKLQKLKSEMT